MGFATEVKKKEDRAVSLKKILKNITE